MKRVLRRAFLTSRSPGVGVPPTVESDDADDLVDVVHNSLDHDRRLVVLGFLEEFGEGGYASVLVFDRRGGLLGCDHVSGEVEQFLQELDADQQALLVAVLQILEPFGQRLESGIM